MTKFLFVYHGGGMPDSEEEQAKHMAAWGEWFGSNEGAFVDMGAPVSTAKIVDGGGVSDGGGANPAGGYGLVEAADFDTACAIAAGCPVIALSGGSVQVAETFEVSM